MSNVSYLEERLRNARASLARDQEDILKPQYQNARDQAILKNTIAQQQDVIANLEEELALARAQEAKPVASSADTTAQSQVARDDGANNSATPATQKEVGADGRVVEKAAAAPTNADAPQTTANGNVDVGTNAETVTLANSQGIPGGYGSGANNPSLIPVPPLPAKVATSRAFVPADTVASGGRPGAGAGNDDTAKKTTPPTSVVNRLDELYAGAQNAIVSQDNILDQFASYTYSLSWYVLDHATYNSLLSSDTKYLNSFYLLVQSGGAPTQNKIISNNAISAGNAGFVQAPGELGRGGAGTVGAGRSPFFPLDYYLDNFQLDTAISGTPGSTGAAKITTLSFTVTEPNGISLQTNLVRAINDIYWKAGLVKQGTPVNYVEAHYCMVIRFYGYDSQGNLIVPIDTRVGATDRQAVIEKFVPFNITKIDFKVANKLVEYNIKGAPIEQLTAFSTDRGSIPQNFQFQGTTVKDILQGKSFTQTAASEDTQPLTDTVFGRG